ncbi:ribonuclease 3 drosha [Lycorma delicatula]|uniref:ribonuclease 3 drosha n=1 Tax=Lycorma delicatula TaxID=130591 RepID=UPI003F51549B
MAGWHQQQFMNRQCNQYKVNDGGGGYQIYNNNGPQNHFQNSLNKPNQNVGVPNEYNNDHSIPSSAQTQRNTSYGSFNSQVVNNVCSFDNSCQNYNHHRQYSNSASQVSVMYNGNVVPSEPQANTSYYSSVNYSDFDNISECNIQSGLHSDSYYNYSSNYPNLTNINSNQQILPEECGNVKNSLQTHNVQLKQEPLGMDQSYSYTNRLAENVAYDVPQKKSVYEDEVTAFLQKNSKYLDKINVDSVQKSYNRNNSIKNLKSVVVKPGTSKLNSLNSCTSFENRQMSLGIITEVSSPDHQLPKSCESIVCDNNSNINHKKKIISSSSIVPSLFVPTLKENSLGSNNESSLWDEKIIVDNSVHSPERKYLHMIDSRSKSKSPVSEFLDKISRKNKKSVRSRSRSSSRYSTDSRSRSSSREQNSSSPERRSRGRNIRSFSRSPTRSISRKRSLSPGRHSRSRVCSRSPEPHILDSSQHDYRVHSQSPSRKYLKSCTLSPKHSSSCSRSPSLLRSQSKPCSRPSFRGRNNSFNRNGSDRLCRSLNSCNVPLQPLSDSNRKQKIVEDFSGKGKQYTEREALLLKYRKDYCSDVYEMRHKLNELSKLNVEELMKKETQFWTRMSPADLYYIPTENSNILEGTSKLESLCNEFEEVLVKRAERIRTTQPKYEPPIRKKKMKFAKHKSEHCGSSSSDSDCESSSDEEDCTMEELERKRSHPFRLHTELWFNDVGEMNDGPLCRCSAKARRSGIRHNIYAGELNLPKCDVNTNNASNLYHYRITISPPTNFLIKTPTIIPHDDHEFIFEGFSMFSHIKLDKLPVCKVIRFNIEYTILYFEEKMPENFTIRELDLFYEYLFKEILELVDLDFKAGGDKSRCAQFHFMPRFVRELPDNGKEILSMNEVLVYLLKNSDDLIKSEELEQIQVMPQYEWQKQVDLVKGMVVTLPGIKPCSLRVDQLDRDRVEGKTSLFPEIVHFGIRPPQLSYAGNPEYQKAWREYVKFRHLLANMPKPSFEDKRKLEVKENKLQEMRTQSKMKRDVTVTVNSEGFKKTGIMCDIVQHAMLIPVLVSHLRFHCSLGVLEEMINYKFENRFLLQLALTHPSYRENFGTNPDHARNSLTNCGIRQPEYGDRRIHYMNTRKRGINTLINIMSRFGKKTETESNITHNERLEFLGDAVVEFITSIHLFHMFPDLEEGGLATYRAAIVQNQHLAVLAKTLKLDEFMLYAHGSDLCHDLELRHAMANCFEALMGALFLDGGIEVADKVFGETLFKTDSELLEVWVNYPPHPLQEQEPLGDRKWIPRFELLKKLTEFEESIGIEFTHIRLLARAFTDRSIGYTNLTLGSNQRLEFLGDTVLQLIASEYLYKYFPEHHEGHLSLLRSSLVNNRTQAVVCNDLGMTKYALYHNPKAELKTKDRADLLEAFLGALYVDKGLVYCEVFCNVCFFPRLQTFIMRQDWNDPKSKLQQCCLTLRTMEGGEPEIPIYKVIECMGPTNTRIYTVAVYFKGQRLAEASGHSIQQAEMNAAKKALQRSQGLFPQLDHQKRVIAKSLKSQHTPRQEINNHQRSGKKPFYFNKTYQNNFVRKDNAQMKINSRCTKNDRNNCFKKPLMLHKKVPI